jgi:imidazole glycerol-phosphate synthase subunit HisF
MLKKRLIASLVIKNGIVVQSIGFERYLPIGKPEITVDYLNQWGIDEIIMVDIDAAREGRCIDPELVKRVAKRCFVPLSVGGGITSVDQIHTLIHSGADKVSLNTQAFTTPSLIEEGARFFGSQCMVVSIDAKCSADGSYRAYTHGGKTDTALSPAALAQQAQAFGAGEILINSIDRDGHKNGYDIDLIRSLLSATNLPLIALGGAKDPFCMKTLLQSCDVSAIAAGNYFHFIEHSATIAKAYLSRYFPDQIRLDGYSDYRDFSFDEMGRIVKKEDKSLRDMLFEFHPKEVI